MLKLRFSHAKIDSMYIAHCQRCFRQNKQVVVYIIKLEYHGEHRTEIETLAIWEKILSFNYIALKIPDGTCQP